MKTEMRSKIHWPRNLAITQKMERAKALHKREAETRLEGARLPTRSLQYDREPMHR